MEIAHVSINRSRMLRDEILHNERHIVLGEGPGSSDGGRKTLLRRQMTFEPLPASIVFALGDWCWLLM